MSLDSPVASEPDSLGDKEPIDKLSGKSNFARGHINSSTFTRQRPTNLHRHQVRVHRQSLLSPHSVDNLDTDDVNTPDFEMTQSMYEPYGKKEQIEKLTQQSKLMSLLASEKAAYAAQKRKQKEMKQKTVEQKKRNEERQKMVEERRIRMLATEEEKRKRILNKTIRYNNTASTGMSQSIMVRNSNQGSSNKFLSNRPLSSTGKIFGFGSSAPRYICDPIKHVRSSNNSPSLLDMRKESMPLSRMCVSQIVSKTTQNDNKGQSAKNLNINLTKSTVSISDMTNSRNKNVRGSTSNVNVNNSTRNKTTRTTPRNIKNLNSNHKPDMPPKKPMEVNNRSRSSTKDANIPTKPRAKTTERQINSSSTLTIPKSTVTHNTHPVTSPKIEENKKNSKTERSLSTGRKTQTSANRPLSILPNDSESHPNTGKKFEVRFVNTSEDSDRNDKENTNVVSEDSTCTAKEVTKDEYKERMNLRRKLAKEKKLKEEIEREAEKEKIISVNPADLLTPVDTSFTSESEVSKEVSEVSKEVSEVSKEVTEVSYFAIQPKDKDVHELPCEKPIDIAIFTEEIKKGDQHVISTNIQLKDREELERNPDSILINDKQDKSDDPNLTVTNIIAEVPSIEVSNPKGAMAASTDDLDRIERKKRLESIMSRIKKTPVGSSENLNQHMTTSALQNMMDKGHLSGMSKTAAVLMRNANRSSELLTSTSDIPSATDDRKPSISLENIINNNYVDDTSISRGDCDGKEDSPKDVNPDLATKSNIMQNLSANTDGNYFNSWKEKYSVNDSLDSENDVTE